MFTTKKMLPVAIVGAGPYGLSIAAHFRRHGIGFRIFGRPMDSWLAHMPRGMMLKSDGFASDIYDPDRDFTLGRFCAERGIEYSDTGVPVSLDTFAAYGLEFKERMVPELEDRLVTEIEMVPGGFELLLETKEKVMARHVVLAVGITHFSYIPAQLSSLPRELLTHSFHHHEPSVFKGRNVIVIGGGASALDLAALIHEAGADVRLLARAPALKFHSGPAKYKPSLWKRIRHPQSGLGPGLRSCFFARGAAAFHYLPERLRLHFVRTVLGPSGGWFIRDKVIGKIPLLLGHTVSRAEAVNGTVRLWVRASDGTEREVMTEHVIAATGYRVDLNRLPFLGAQLRSRIKAVNGAPVLSSSFESSIPGLYFAGVASANSFGPVMRFAFGAGFAAKTLTTAFLKRGYGEPLLVPTSGELKRDGRQVMEKVTQS